MTQANITTVENVHTQEHHMCYAPRFYSTEDRLSFTHTFTFKCYYYTTILTVTEAELVEGPLPISGKEFESILLHNHWNTITPIEATTQEAIDA